MKDEMCLRIFDLRILPLTKRGHEVILCEKEAELSGILKSEQAIPFKYEMYQLTGT